jgi:hypothetical protein
VIPGIAGTESEGTSFRSVPERDILFQERLSHNVTKAAALYVRGKSEVRGGLWATPVPGYRKLPVFRHFLVTGTGTQVTQRYRNPGDRWVRRYRTNGTDMTEEPQTLNKRDIA